MAMFPDLLRRDRERAGLSIGQAAWRLGLTPAAYRRLEEGKAWPDWETYDRIERLFGWPRSFAGGAVAQRRRYDSPQHRLGLTDMG